MLARPSSSSYVLVDDVCSRPRAVEELGFVDRDSVVDRLRPEELQAAEGFFRLRDEALRVGPLRHVALHGDGSPAIADDLAHHPLRAGLIARVIHDHRRTLRAESFCNARSDSF
jgi:hypothetical protein